MVLRIRPVPTWFPTSILYIPVENIPFPVGCSCNIPKGQTDTHSLLELPMELHENNKEAHSYLALLDSMSTSQKVTKAFEDTREDLPFLMSCWR